MKRPEGVHIFAWGKSGPSKSEQRKSSNHQTSARLNQNSIGEFHDDGIGVDTNSNDCREGEFAVDEFKDSNASDDQIGEVDSGDITKNNDGVSDGEVGVGSGESMRGVIGDEIGDNATSNNRGEVDLRNKSGEVHDEEIQDANVQDDHNGEVDSGDITKNHNGVSDGEVGVGSGESLGRIFDHGIGAGAVVEYIHNSNDSGEENKHLDENISDEENQDDNSSVENNHYEIPLSELDCYFLLGLPCDIRLTKEIINRAYRKAMKLAHSPNLDCFFIQLIQHITITSFARR